MIIRHQNIFILLFFCFLLTASVSFSQTPIPKEELTKEDEKKLEEIVDLKLKADEYSKEAEEIYNEISQLKSSEGLTNQSSKVKNLRKKALKKDIQAFEKLKERHNKTYQLYKKHLKKFAKDSTSSDMNIIKAKLLQEDAREFFYRASSLRREAYNQTQNLEEKFEKMEKANNIEKLGMEKVEQALRYYYQGSKKEQKTKKEKTGNNEKYGAKPGNGDGKVVVNKKLLRNIKKTLEKVEPRTYPSEFYRLKVRDTVSSTQLKDLWFEYLYPDQAPSEEYAEKEVTDTAKEMDEDLLAQETGKGEKIDKEEEAVTKEKEDIAKEPEDKQTYEEKTEEVSAKEKMRGVVFRVQIAADKKPLSQATLRKLYSDGKKEITRVVENGWYKYSIGDFYTFKKAQNFKSELNIKDAFIVAYKNGQKMSPGQIQRTLADKGEKEQEQKDRKGPAGEGSVVFQVQVAASKEPMTQSKIRSIYSGPLSITQHKVKGWNKYAIGEYDNYQDANELKKVVDVDGAFVTAYRGGELLDIKEAIRLTTGGYKKTSKKEYADISTEGLTFKVQIAADRIKMSDSELDEIYSGPKKIQMNKGEGWYRYSVCNCPSYYHAAQIRKNLNVKGAFVVVYKDGKRYNAYRYRNEMRCPDIRIRKELEKSSSVIFKVQIAASSFQLTEDGLKYIYCGSSDVLEYRENGWYKYAVGSFPSYDEASRLKGEICVPGAFVVAFRNGKKISVTEIIK
jgi:hypothetical protein